MVDSKYINGNIVMNYKDMPNISRYADLHLQPVRKLHVAVEVIDDNNETVETVEGLAVSGNVNVSNSSLIRRTGDLSFVLFDYLLPKVGNILWMTNKIRAYAGLEDLSASDGTVTYFCLGTFYITEPNVTVDNTQSVIQINLEDNMMRWEGTQLEEKLVINANVPLHTAMESVLNSYGEWNTNIEFTDLVVPYKLEFEIGDTVSNVIQKLRDLYMDWECFYDIDGTFVFRRMDIQKSNGEPIIWSFDDTSDLLTSYKESMTYKDVKNRIVVIGQIDSTTGITPKSDISITLTTSPFYKDNVGGVKTKVVADTSIITQVQSDARAKYELFQASTFQKKIDVKTLPIYFLEANDVINVRNPNTQELEPYIVDSISMGLGVSDEMSLNCHKLYYDTFDVNSSLEQYQTSADMVINGIQNYGWLALAEQRISDYYGLKGDMSKLIVRFEYDSLDGTTAYTTGYDGQTTQTMTIDLADFSNPQGESGDNGAGKAQYSDRVLGHEMVHAVMNNVIGISSTELYPSWFKEGVAEFIHGADERIKISIVTDTAIDSTKVGNIVTIASGLLNNSDFQSTSDYYSASTIIIKYLDKKLSVGKDWKTFMQSLIDTTELGVLAIQGAIVDNTDFATYQDFVNDFTANVTNYINTGITLNIGADEVDTGSVGGTDHRGTVLLNAEDVFDNSLAVAGQSSIGFTIEFDRP